MRDSAALAAGGVGALDAVQIASAQIIGESLEVLVTYDKRMRDVARRVGLPVEAPGLD